MKTGEIQHTTGIFEEENRKKENTCKHMTKDTFLSNRILELTAKQYVTTQGEITGKDQHGTHSEETCIFRVSYEGVSGRWGSKLDSDFLTATPRQRRF